MAIALDGSISSSSLLVDSSKTISHTVGSGSARVLAVTVTVDGYVTVSGVTWNGTSMGAAVYTAYNSTVGIRSYGFLLVAPASGTFDVVVSLSGGGCGLVTVSDWTGVDQGSPTRATPPTATTSSSANGDVTEADAQSGDVVIGSAGVNQTAITADGGQTSLGEADNPAGNGTSHSASYESAGGSTTLSWTAAAGSYWAMGAMALVPEAAASGQPAMARHNGTPGMSRGASFGRGW